MGESEELKKIKKLYGEYFMHFCRKMFPTILEQEGKLYSILTSTFSENCKTLYEDIKRNLMEKEFKNAIYEIASRDNKNQAIVTTSKTPYELLAEAGYDLYECHTEEDIQKFKKYYAPNEALCTFRGGRLARCVVFFAVRKDVDKIKREDFQNPKRQDKYGTSVMSIQFEKNGICTCSIKNRYNHTVKNPDATYGNDLDRIIPGLSNSFKKLLKQRGLLLDRSNVSQFELPNYVRANDGKFYKCNQEDDGIYYCPGNILIVNGQVHKIENPEKNILIDNYILDLENKTVKLALSETAATIYEPKDEFVKSLGNIKNIKVEKDREKGNGCRKITIWHTDTEEPSIIEINRNNQITGFTNSKIKQISQEFLPCSMALESLRLPNLTSINDYQGISLKHIDFPNLEYAGVEFLDFNSKIKEINLPKLKKAGGFSFSKVEKVYLPSLKEAESGFLAQCEKLKEVYFPELEKVGSSCFQGTQIKEMILPKLREVGDNFLSWSSIQTLHAPLLKKAGDLFLNYTSIESLSLPMLEEIGDFGICINSGLTRIYLPKLATAGEGLFKSNNSIKNAYFPELKTVGKYSFNYNLNLSTLGLPKVEEIGEGSINGNEKLEIVIAPMLQKLGLESLENLPDIKLIGMPALLPEYREKIIVMEQHPNKLLNEVSSQEMDRILQNQFRKSIITSNDIASLDKSKGITESEILVAKGEVEKDKNMDRDGVNI